MASVSMNRLFDDIRIRAPGVIDTTMKADLFDAADELLRRSGAWRQVFEIEVAATTADPVQDPDAFTYQLSPPAGSMCVRLIGVIDPNKTPVRASMPVSNYIQLASSPNEDAVYLAQLVLTVLDPVTRTGEPVLPDWIVQKYRGVLLDGTLARLMGQQAKPYTNIALAAYHKASFNRGCGRARIDADRGNVQGGQAWTFPQSFNATKFGRG